MITVICSAIHYNDGKVYVHQPKNITTGIVVCGRRHHNCFFTLAQFANKADKQKITQGFLTSDDNFVTREEAYTIALKAGQIRPMDDSSGTPRLMSEILFDCIAEDFQ